MASAEARRNDPVVIERPDAAWFASDLHLDDDRPGLTTRFVEALRALAAQASTARASASRGRDGLVDDRDAPALFLLGDLFEYWIGDDHPSAVAARLADELAALDRRGWRLFLMRGNRDFLLGDDYARRCHAVLLDEPAVVEIAGQRLVLVHGDAECVDDTRYQQWRQLSHSAAWQRQFLERSIDERLAMARAARAASLAHRQTQADARQHPEVEADSRVEGSGDLSPVAVTALLDLQGASGLIHGHTHRPACHRLAGDHRRWVLSDWETLPPRGEIVSFAALKALPAQGPLA